MVSHNVYWFQGHPYQGDQPGAAVTGIFNECIALYRTLRPTLMGLQEIQSAVTAASAGAALEMASQYIAGGGFRQYGGCVLGPAAPPPDDDAILAAVQPARLWQRVDLPVAGLPDGLLRVVNVHSPSDRQLGAAASQTRRLAEFRAGLAQTPPVDVVLGDFNERPGLPVSELLAAAGYIDCAQITGHGESPTTVGGKRSDWIWIRAGLQPRLQAYGVVPARDFVSVTPAKQYLSDHLPLWIDLDFALAP